MHLSVVIPAFNEAAVLPQTLDVLGRYLAAQPYECEVIVVDDGSTDETPAVLASFHSPRAAIRVLRNASNLGKGASLRNGILASRGEYVLFIDADLPARPEDIERLLAPLYLGQDIAIASRSVLPGGCASSGMRLIASKLYRRSAGAILGLPVRDTQCGFKAFVRESVLPGIADLRQSGYSFDAEFLFVAWRLGLSIQEVEIDIIERRDCVRHAILLSAPRMLWDLFRIRFGAGLGSASVVSEVARFLLGFSTDLSPAAGKSSSELP